MTFAQQPNIKYSPFMNYLQNKLLSNSHCSTYYNTLLYACVGEGYCELILQISYL